MYNSEQNFIKSTYNYTDSTLVHFACPRCGGEFTLYIQTFGESYLKDIIAKLHPELEGKVDDDLLRQINDRMWPEYKDCRITSTPEK